MTGKVQWRRDTAANWTTNDPILAPGEPGFEVDTAKFKIGDGTTPWTYLDYSTGSGGGSAVASVNGLTGAVELYATPEKYAYLNTTTDGETDWTAAIEAALADKSWVQLQGNKTYWISGLITLGEGQYLIGRSHQDNDATTMTHIKCLTTSAGIQASGTGCSIQDVCIDGNNISEVPLLVGDTTTATSPGAGHYYKNIFVTGGVTCNATIARVQNSHFDSVNFGQTAAGPSSIIEWGAGGLKFTRCEFSQATGGPCLYLTTGGTSGPYPYPEHITFDTCIFEYRDDAGVILKSDTNATSILFDHCGFSGPSVSSGSPLVDVTGNTRQFVFRDSNINLTGGAGGQIFLNAHGTDTSTYPFITFAGTTNCGANNGQALIAADANSTVRVEGPVDGLSDDAALTTTLFTSGSTLQNIYRKRQVYDLVQLGDSPSSTVEAVKRWSDTTYLFERQANGTLLWGPGGTTAIDCGLYRSATKTMTFNTDLYANRFLKPTNAITLMANGSVNLDLSLSDKHLIYLDGYNLTGLTFTNEVDNQIFDVLIQQGSVAGTIALPGSSADVLWNGGDTNKPTAPAAYGVMSFRLTTLTSGTYFIELSRSQGGGAGTPGTPGTNGSTWYEGSGAPSGGIGVVGDFYLNVATADIYTKGSGGWGSPIINIKGTPGTNGTNGSTWYEGSGAPSSGTGVNGDFYYNTATGDIYTKSGGSWGTPVGNIMGTPGTPGTNGTNGSQGPVGASGGNVVPQLMYNNNVGYNRFRSGVGSYCCVAFGDSITEGLYVGGTATTNSFTFTNPGTGTWVAPAGCTAVTVAMWGGGGGSGGASLSGRGSGGGGGGFSESTLTVVPGTSYNFQIGAGGVSGGTSGAGGNGTDSWFGTTGTLLAKAGQGGGYAGAAGGAGGSSSSGVGTIRSSGGSGSVGGAVQGGGGGGSGGSTGGGGNGSATAGGAAGAGTPAGVAGSIGGGNNVNGVAGLSGGGGAGGAGASAGTTLGAAGGNGLMVLTILAGLSTRTRDMWTSQLGLKLAAKAGHSRASIYYPSITGSGTVTMSSAVWPEVTSPWTYSGSWTGSDSGHGLGARTLIGIPNCSATLTNGAPAGYTHALISYSSTANSVTLTITSGGVVVANLLCSDTNEHLTLVELNGPGESFEVSVTGSGNVAFNGVTFRDLSQGENNYIDVIESGHAGAAAHNFANDWTLSTAYGVAWAAAIALYNPDVVLITLGVNDAQQGRTSSDFLASLEQITTYIDAACTDLGFQVPDYMFIAYPYLNASDLSEGGGTYYSPATWTSYVAQMQTAVSALASGRAVLHDLSNWIAPIAGPSQFSFDGAHPTEVGAYVMEESIEHRLVPA